jgi:hypothetical protein
MIRTRTDISRRLGCLVLMMITMTLMIVIMMMMTAPPFLPKRTRGALCDTPAQQNPKKNQTPQKARSLDKDAFSIAKDKNFVTACAQEL